jgi:hypothetical protein
MVGRHIALTAAAALGMAPVASGSIMTLYLSTDSSDQTPAEHLSATVDFSVVGTILTINITNDTLAPDEFNVSEFYFNAPDGVSLTVNTLPARWQFDDTGSMADGFGTFDFALTNPSGQSHASHIQPGQTQTFIFDVIGGADVKDFTTAFSDLDPPGAMPALIAAKFVNGPNDDSAYGATVPTPGVLAMMAVAGVVASRPRRRRD